MGTRLMLSALIGLGLLAGQPVAAVAEHDHSGHAHTDGKVTSSEHGKQCELCQQSGAELEKVLGKIAQAKQSNDIAQIHSLLGEVEKPLAELKEHMAMCQMKMGKAESMCSMCKVKLDKDGRCPQCGMKM